MSGRINTQNCRIWFAENRQEIVKEGFHEEKITVWCCYIVKIWLVLLEEM